MVMKDDRDGGKVGGEKRRKEKKLLDPPGVTAQAL